MTVRGRLGRTLLWSMAGLLASPRLALAQANASTAPPATSQNEPATAVLPQTGDHAWWLSGQLNLIEQAHDAFLSPYDGPNSLRASREHALSRVWTVDTGYRLSPRLEVLFDLESAGGGGISDALGL